MEIPPFAFDRVTYVEIKMSTGFLYLNSQPNRIKPEARTNKPTSLIGSTKPKLDGIPVMMPIKYPKATETATTVKTTSDTKKRAFNIEDDVILLNI